MTRTGSHLPGDRSPGRTQPGMSTPGARAPGERVEETVESTVTVDSTGDDDIGTLTGSRISIKEVLVEGEVYGFDFNVEVEGTTLFDDDQSPESTDEESFTPDTAPVIVADDAQASATVDITSESSSDDATADFTLVAEVEDE